MSDDPRFLTEQPRLTAQDAEEWTQALGQTMAGQWRQVQLAVKLRVPEALGLSTERWVHDRLGGYLKMSMQERHDVFAELSETGHSVREISAITGVSKSVVAEIVRKRTARAEKEARIRAGNEALNGATRCEALLDAVERNLGVMKALRDKYIPGDYKSARRLPEDIEQYFDEMLALAPELGRQYDEALDCGDYDRAFELAAFFHRMSEEDREFVENVTQRIEVGRSTARE
jgi:hypothetical protein